MRRILLAVLLAAALLPGQQKKETEEEALRNAMGEAGSSPTEMIRALEKHLERFPKSARRAEIERALAKSSIDARDNERILKYGEIYLAADPTDLIVLERVTRLLTSREDKESNERGLKYAEQFRKGILELEKQPPEEGRITAQMREDLDRGLGRSYTFQARALGHLGRFEEAVTAAKAGYAAFASSEPALDAAKWLLKLGKNEEALRYYADAFAMQDSRVTEEDRTRIRQQMGEAYRKVHGNEKGMGDLILEAYDRGLDVVEKRKARAREFDPNANLTNPMEFTLSGVSGDKIDLKTLRGKVVVLDFWATWCGPCRIQYPMYQKVKQRFATSGDVVFLGINTDQDRSIVQPFLRTQKWEKAVYFEDGLSSLLRVSSIPATVIFNKKGELAARMNGFVPERFEDMLTERIREALAK